MLPLTDTRTCDQPILTEPDKKSVMPVFDGHACFVANAMNGFVANNSFMVRPNVDSTCRAGTPWGQESRGLRCQMMPKPGNSFIWHQGFYTYYDSCSRGQNDGVHCLLANAPAYTRAFEWNNAFYHSPIPSCPVAGSWFDSQNCYVMPKPVTGFIWHDSYYMSWDACSAGSNDGIHCYRGTAPAGTRAFEWGGGFYYTPLPGNRCPLPGSWFDGYNCYVMPKPYGGFIWHNAYYGKYDACSRGQNDGVHCLLASAPGGSAPFEWGGGFYYHAVNSTYCPIPGSWFDGNNCYVMPKPATGFVWRTSYYMSWDACRQGQNDGGHCYLGSAPDGTIPDTYSGYFVAIDPNPPKRTTCPMGSYNGYNCFYGRAPDNRTATWENGKFYYYGCGISGDPCCAVGSQCAHDRLVCQMTNASSGPQRYCRDCGAEGQPCCSGAKGWVCSGDLTCDSPSCKLIKGGYQASGRYLNRTNVTFSNRAADLASMFQSIASTMAQQCGVSDLRQCELGPIIEIHPVPPLRSERMSSAAISEWLARADALKQLMSTGDRPASSYRASLEATEAIAKDILSSQTAALTEPTNRQNGALSGFLTELTQLASDPVAAAKADAATRKLTLGTIQSLTNDAATRAAALGQDFALLARRYQDLRAEEPSVQAKLTAIANSGAAADASQARELMRQAAGIAQTETAHPEPLIADLIAMRTKLLAVQTDYETTLAPHAQSMTDFALKPYDFAGVAVGAIADMLAYCNTRNERVAEASKNLVEALRIRLQQGAVTLRGPMAPSLSPAGGDSPRSASARSLAPLRERLAATAEPMRKSARLGLTFLTPHYRNHRAAGGLGRLCASAVKAGSSLEAACAEAAGAATEADAFLERLPAVLRDDLRTLRRAGAPEALLRKLEQSIAAGRFDAAVQEHDLALRLTEAR